MRSRVIVVVVLVAACSPSSDAPKEPRPLPPLTSAPLVTERTVVLAHARAPEDDLSPSNPDDLAELLDQGFGDTKFGPGAAVTTETLDGAPPPAPGPHPRLLARFVHLADTQLADDESPARLVDFDATTITDGAYRPQEAWGCRILDAAVRTIDKVNERLPIDFVLLGGDNADNAQTNEVGWFMQVLDGAPSVKCDSGAPNDPVPGPDNDPKDAFVAPGLDMPWKWVTGNHDLENQGTLPIDADTAAEYVGTNAPEGTRDWSEPGGPLTSGPVVADPKRAPVTRASLMKMVAGDRDGHGLGDANRASGKAFYTFDAKGGGLRFLVLDTIAETGGADAVLHRSDLETFVKPALEQADLDNVYVILVSHQPAGSFTDGSDFGGTKQDDAVTPDEWRALLASHPHVLLHLAGHTHRYRVGKVTTAGAHAYWEAETASLMDWPQQVRVFEVWDEDDGDLLVRAIPLDYSTEGDAVAAQARRRAAADYTAGWTGSSGPGPEGESAVELWMPKVAP